jgi:hypothetical protein
MTAGAHACDMRLLDATVDYYMQYMYLRANLCQVNKIHLITPIDAAAHLVKYFSLCRDCSTMVRGKSSSARSISARCSNSSWVSKNRSPL